MRRLSRQLLATRREAPADASTTSHALLVRAGMLQPSGAGGFVLGPLLVRVVRRIEALVCEELAAIGGEEVRFTILQPPDAWRATGRWEALTRTERVLLRTCDRTGAELVLAPGHEEQAALFAREHLSSHRQLPVVVYRIGPVLRDEARPRSGLLRTRELTTAAAYAYDVDETAARATFDRLVAAHERVLGRCGLDVLTADATAPGASRTAQLLAPVAIGDELAAVSDAGGYCANAAVARAVLAAPDAPAQRPMSQVETPGATTMEALAPFVPDVPAERMVKTLLYAALTESGPQVVAALCRGDRSVDQGKLARAVGATEVGMADPVTVRDLTGAEPGYAGPVGLPDGARVIGDHAVADVQGFVCGANANGTHLRDVWWSRDVALPELADLDRVADGDTAADGGTLSLTHAVEAGRITLLDTRYTEPLGVAVAGPDGVERPVWMCASSIAVERVAATLVEQCHDDVGIVWPAAVAPHTAVVVTVRPDDEIQERLSERVTGGLLDAGVDAVWDERDARAGVKFTDAELIGFPWRVTVGRDAADGRVELTARSGADRAVVDAAEAVRRIAEAAASARVPPLP